MKIFLDDSKSMDFNIYNWNTKIADYELEALRGLLVEFISLIGELPVYDNETGNYNMRSIIENEYVFNMALKWFAFHFNLAIEAPIYMVKTINPNEVPLIVSETPKTEAPISTDISNSTKEEKVSNKNGAVKVKKVS